MSSNENECLYISIPLDVDVAYVDRWAVILAFFIGLILGLIVAFILFRCCHLLFLCAACCRWRKTYDKYFRAEIEVTTSKVHAVAEEESSDEEMEFPPSGDAVLLIDPETASGKPRKKRRRADLVAKAGDYAFVLGLLLRFKDKDGRNGLADILFLNDQESMGEEAYNQDMDDLAVLENDMIRGRILTLLQLAKILLNILIKKDKVTPEFKKQFMENLRGKIVAAINEADDEKEKQIKVMEQNIKNDPKLSKDPNALQNGLEQIETRHLHNLNIKIRGVQNDMRTDLLKMTDMTEEEVDEVMHQITAGLAAYETRFNEQMTKQQEEMEERLAKRRELAQLRSLQMKQDGDTVGVHKLVHRNILNEFVEDQRINQKEADALLNEYAENTAKLTEAQQIEYLQHKTKLQAELKERRTKRMNDLLDKQRSEIEELCDKTDDYNNTGEFLQELLSLLEDHRVERETLIQEDDKEEEKELNRFNKDFTNSVKEDFQNEDRNFLENIEKITNMDEEQAMRLYQRHSAQMEEFEKMKLLERKRLQGQISERLSQRKMKKEEDNKLALAQQISTNENEKGMINRVLNRHIDLDDEAKKRIMMEHEQNMTAINNHLQISKMRQQKELEQKLSRKKQKLRELRAKQDDAKSEKERNNIDQQVHEEEDKVEEERRKAVADLRAKLQKETEECLKYQESNIGVMIGRLQAGQARRKAIIAKQDKMLERLQGKLEKTGDLAMNDQILQEYYNNVNHLSETLERTRDHQELLLKEKLERKKRSREKKLEEKLSAEASDQQDQNITMNAGTASTIFAQLLYEQKHKHEMEQLENDMKIELQRQKADLDETMTRELEVELEKQRAEFLLRLASNTDMSPDDKAELEDIIKESQAAKEEEGKSARRRRKKRDDDD